jgi:hypothetical protein
MKNSSPFFCFLVGLFLLLYGVDGFRHTRWDHTRDAAIPRFYPPASKCNWGLFGLGRILGHPTRQN